MSQTVGVGLDLVDVERFRTVIQRRPGVLTRLFTAREITESNSRVERLAVRFAAKEATFKVLGVGVGAARWRDVEVRLLPSGQPRLYVSGAAATLAAEAGVTTWHVSLSHTDLSAGAVVMGNRS
jgi:holo-[acyl-carrier protein] synthase